MPLERHSMRDHIKRELMERILDGDFQPGDRLVELQIAKEMNTSQGPVREALRDLEGLGLVKSERYKGTRVRALSRRELKESYQIRAVLEELAGQLAAAKLKDNTSQLEAELAGNLKGAKAADRKVYAVHAYAFHRAIVEASGNRALLHAWESVLLESHFRVTVLSMTDRQLIANADDRKAIVEALRKGQGKVAGRLLREHVEQFYASPDEQ